MIPPTIAQERALTFAPAPFAALSFLSSGYVIHHLLRRRRDKLERMYHRLVLALNVALVLFSVCYVWGPFAVPEGTARNPFAAGSTQTCTAQGFIFLMCVLASPVYYGSLSVQAYLAIKNNFKEEKYKWIEKWIHVAALCVPLALSAIVAARENFNATIGSCFLRKAPLGCETDPDVPCERGKGIEHLEFVVGLGLILLYFVLPPSLTASMYCWIGRLQKGTEGGRGLRKMREAAQRRMMRVVARQIYLYLFSFWSTWVFGMVQQAHRILTGGRVLYDLHILASCLHASQGFVFAVVYFALQRLGHVPKVDGTPPGASSGAGAQPTVRSIRLSAARKGRRQSEAIDEGAEGYDFNIFDGVPDEGSPWARFIDPDSDDDGNDVDAPYADVTQTNT